MNEPNGRIPPPHPRHKSHRMDRPPDGQNPMIRQLRKDLESLHQDIELNYRRLNYHNAVVVKVLLMIRDLLGHCLKLLEFQEPEKEKPSPFATSKEAIQ